MATAVTPRMPASGWPDGGKDVESERMTLTWRPVCGSVPGASAEETQMKAFVAAIVAIIVLSAAGAVGLEYARVTSSEAGSGANVRLD